MAYIKFKSDVVSAQNESASENGLKKLHFFQLTHYWKRVDEAYPSKYTALKTLSKGKNLKFKLKLCLYSLWIWYIDKRRR